MSIHLVTMRHLLADGSLAGTRPPRAVGVRSCRRRAVFRSAPRDTVGVSTGIRLSSESARLRAVQKDRQEDTLERIVAAIWMSFAFGGCCMHAEGAGANEGEGHMQSRGGFHAEARGRLDLHGRGRVVTREQANANAAGHAQAGATGGAAAHAAPSTAPCPAIHRAKRPVAFHGLFRPRERVRPTKRAGRLQRVPQAEGQPPAAEPQTPPDDLASPSPPPDTPPENPFGYDRPVLGCLEGQVYFLDPNTANLPASYDGRESAAALYACEWDIPTRDWEQGFPGIPDRFEWFAIRYSGAFAVAAAGRYHFRISSDDGAKLVIDGTTVIDNDGLHPPQERTGDVDLTAGDHTITLEYFQGPRYHINLQVWVTPPGEGATEGLFSVRGE
jgi:hypothetical protein